MIFRVALAALTLSVPNVAPSDASLKAAADYSKSEQGQSCLVMFEGKIIFEQYANGGALDRLQMLASGSKSFVGLAAVAAVQDGLLQFDDRAVDNLPEWKNDPRKSTITYRQLLSLTSGLTPGESGSALRSPSWKDILAKPMTGTPGAQFEYGPYQLNAAACALERKLNRETFEQYLKRRILDPIGATVEWRFKCVDGHPQVGSGAFMTARDWAKVGELVRLGGVWNGKMVLDSQVLAQCFQGTAQNSAYGLTWWLKSPVSAEQSRAVPLLAREWGEVANSNWLPSDLVAACGAGKQRLYVIPSRQLVIVRQGRLSQGFSDLKFLGLLLR